MLTRRNNITNSRIDEKINIRREVQHKRTVSAFLPEIVKKNLGVQGDEKQLDFAQHLEERESRSRQFQTPNNSIISHSRGASLDEVKIFDYSANILESKKVFAVRES